MTGATPNEPSRDTCASNDPKSEITEIQHWNDGITQISSPRSSVSGKKKVGIGANMPALRGLETDG